jgi:DNA-binding transcriptional MerR regulator
MTTERRNSPRHPIRVVARRTGLTPAVLRAWEKRYRVVVPSRTDGGQRLYSDDDVVKFSLLHRAIAEGRRISQVASMPMEVLQELVREDDAERLGAGARETVVGAPAGRVLKEAEEAVDQMDPEELERILTRGAMVFSVSTVIDDILAPLLSRIEIAWQTTRIGAAQEHLATVLVRRFLEWMLGSVNGGEGAPLLVAATPQGERHELGALLSAVSGAAEGWKAVFLGPDLPAEEIGAAALRLEAGAVTLFCVDPSGAEALPGEVRKIRGCLPADVHLFVGGPTAATKRMALVAEGLEFIPSFQELRASLRELASSR